MCAREDPVVTFSTRVQGLDLVLIYTSRRRDERQAPLKMPAWEATAGCLNWSVVFEKNGVFTLVPGKDFTYPGTKCKHI